MPAVDLLGPARADLDLAIAGRRAVADHEMIRHAVLHLPHPAVVGVENARVALPGAAVVHDDVSASAFFTGARSIALRTLGERYRQRLNQPPVDFGAGSNPSLSSSPDFSILIGALMSSPLVVFPLGICGGVGFGVGSGFGVLLGSGVGSGVLRGVSFGSGMTSSSSSELFALGFGFSSSSSASCFFGAGFFGSSSSGSGVGFGVGRGVGVDDVLGFGRGVGVAAGRGTGWMSSRARKKSCFFCSSLSSARAGDSAAAMAIRRSEVKPFLHLPAHANK